MNFLLVFKILSIMSRLSNLITEGAFANQSGAMETDTISKNGRSLKSQMSRYRKQRKIISVIFPILVLICVVMVFMKIKIGVMDGKTLLLIILALTAAYQDGLIQKLFKIMKDEE
jgi:hypothetical protein